MGVLNFNDYISESSKEINIFHINDQHGQLDNFSKIKHIVDEEKKLTNVLLVCGGDIFSGNPVVDNHPQKGFPMIDIMNAVGFDNIAAYEQELLDYGTKRLLEIEGLKIYGTAKEKTSVISFNIEGIHPYDIGTIIDKLGIAVRTGHHCAQPIMDFFKIPGTIRASFAFYNSKEEIDIFVEGVKRAKLMLS